MEGSKIVRVFRPNGYRSHTITSHFFNTLTNDWQLLKQFDCSLYFDENVCSIINGDNFYVFDDGRREESCSGSQINLRTGVLTPIVHPKLYYMELAVVDNQIYAFGFYGYKETERIVLRYLSEGNRWIVVSRSMQHFWRQHCAIATHGNSVYVAGGENAWNKPSSLVECFDQGTRQWTKLPNMNRKRCHFVLTIINGFMYAIERKITTAERFDFQRLEWEKVSISGRKVKTFFSIATAQDRIYAIERTSGRFYSIDVEANGKRLRLVCLSENPSLVNGQFELLSKS